jgi:hypothetical protein
MKQQKHKFSLYKRLYSAIKYKIFNTICNDAVFVNMHKLYFSFNYFKRSIVSSNITNFGIDISFSLDLNKVSSKSNEINFCY